MSQPASKNTPNNSKKKREGLSKRFIQKMAEELQALHAK